jgi:hypothetical protein
LSAVFVEGAISIAVGANLFAKQAEGLPCEITAAAAPPLANEFAPTSCSFCSEYKTLFYV